MCISAIVGGVSALVGARSASKARKSQEQAANAQLEQSGEIYQDQRNLFAPYREKGEFDFQKYRENLVGPETYRNNFTDFGNAFGWKKGQQFEESPGYQFRLDQGRQSVEASAAMRHGVMSGATQNALMDYNQGMASQEFNNWQNRQDRLGAAWVQREDGIRNDYMNRLQGNAVMGQNSAAGTAAAAGNYGQNVNNALANIGNAGATGAIGVNNAIQGGLQNGLGLWAYNNERNG